MYLFSFLIIPTVIFILFDKISPNKIFQIFTGIIISLILSVFFWSLSTFYIPNSYTFIGKFMYILLKEYLGLFALTVYVCINYYKEKKLNSVFFVSGYLISMTIFSVAFNYNSNNLYVIFLQPIFFSLYIYLYGYVESWKFSKNDRLFKILLISLFPFLLILLKQFFNSHLINTIVLFVLILALMTLMFFNKKKIFVRNV